MVRDEHGEYWLCAYMLASNEDDDIIVAFLRCVKRWARAWTSRYVVIDDSIAKQRAVRLVFPDLQANK